MDTNVIQILIAMAVYMAATIGIGLAFAKRANANSENYFIGGRSLGPWVAAMSAEASDMSGWLLMGLPGVAYWCGLADAAWTAIGLAVGTYLNWLLVSRRLRRYSVAANNAITLPDFFSNRFHEKKKVVMTIAAVFILVFFTVYASSCLVTCGKLFSTLFNLPYIPMMILGTVFVLLYTLLGGFLAESTSDFMQAIVMVIALIAVVIVSVTAAGGLSVVMENARSIPGFLSLVTTASPVMENGVQATASGAPVFGAPGSYGALSIVSTLAWGLGYFGMPHIIIRFMSVNSQRELKKSARIGITWTLLILLFAVASGCVGRLMLGFDTAIDANSLVFITMVRRIFPGIISGILLSAILAAAMSTADSQLLASASAFASDIYKPVIRKNEASDREMLWAGRWVVLAISAVAVVIAASPGSGTIMSLVSNAWGVFGAAFGPAILLSLFWKRFTFKGATAGIVVGALTDIIWLAFLSSTGIYEIVPGFAAGLAAAVIVSLCDKKPSAEVQALFEKGVSADV